MRKYFMCVLGAVVVFFLEAIPEAVFAADTTTPLAGLKTVSLLQFPALGTPCYGLDPGALEMRLNDMEVQELVKAGLTIPLPQPGSTQTVGVYIKVSDDLLAMNPVNCLDRMEVAFVYPAKVQLSHNGDTYQASVVLQAVEATIVGAGKDDFLARREASIVQLFRTIGQEWKKQNPN
jgi:hypothetical protein